MYLFDTFSNFLSGLGVPGRDKLTASRYVTVLWTREQLESSFKSDWIARKAISIPAFDATREWRAWQAEADQIEKLEATEKRLQLQLKLQQAMVKARLYGGACMLIGVDGNMEKELDPEKIKKDGLKFIHVLAPWQLHVEEMIRDISSPYYGQPEHYILRSEGGANTPNKQLLNEVKIHPSRMVRLTGLDAPDPMINFGWGDPLLQVIHDAVNSAGTVMGSVASLIAEAKFDVIKIPGLTEIFSTAKGTDKLIKRFSEANVAKSVINAIVMDAEEEWERIGVNLTGMPEVLQMYLQIAAGAADIPATRFLGMSPAGLNATGDSDLQNYYDRIASDQELRLRPALEKLDMALQRSALGSYDKDIHYTWNPLWQMDDAQKATIAKTKADAAAVDANTGLIPFEALVKGRCNQLVEDGTYPGLEAAIQEAIENQEMPVEPPMLEPPDDEDGGDDGPPGGPPGGPPKQLAPPNSRPSSDSERLRRLADHIDALWNEANHSRGKPENKGQFGPGGGGEAPTKEELSRKALSSLANKKPSDFHKAAPEEFVAARDKSTRQQFLSAHPAEELAGHKLFMNKDSTAGVSVDPQGDVQNVFNNGGPKGSGAYAMVQAIENGGRTLDCYAGHLNHFYHQFGFEEDMRMKFNPEFAPEGWDFDKMGQPDIVFMSWRGYLGKDGADAIARANTANRANWEAPTKASEYTDDWEAAKESSRTNAASGGADQEAAERGGGKPDKNAGASRRKDAVRSGDQYRTGAGARGGRSLKDAAFEDVRIWNERLIKRNEEGEFGSTAPNRNAKNAAALKALKGSARREAKALAANESALLKTLSGIKSVAARKGKGVVQATTQTSGKHPGKGYSPDAFIDRNGVIHTSNVYDAQRALFEDRRVDLKQPKQVTTLIQRLGETALEMAEGGSSAPTFNLCNVTIKGTNLFCADQIGVPRVEMPVIRASKTGDFVKYLVEQGYEVDEGREKAANLRASQSELSGEKVAASMKRIEEEGKFYKRIVISRDDYILDGHHTWAGQLAHDASDNNLTNDGRQVKVARINIGIIDLIKEAEKWTGGKGKKAASEKAKGLGDSDGPFEITFGPTVNGYMDAGAFKEELHPRNEEGEFGSNAPDRKAQNAAAIAALSGKKAGEPQLKLEPKAIDVGGDEWNKALAVRLETQYQSAKPAMEALLNKYSGADQPEEEGSAEPDEENEYDGPPEPESWDMLSESKQADIESAYYDHELSSYIDSETESWQQNGGALDQAKGNLADGSDAELFINEAIAEYLEVSKDSDGDILRETDTEFPFNALELGQAIRIRYDSDGEGGGSVDVEYDDKLLHSLKADSLEDPDQIEMEGIEKQDYSKLLTEKMRMELSGMLVEKFNDKAQDNASNEEPPDFSDSAKEYMEETYSGMDDDEKFKWAKFNTSIIGDLMDEYNTAMAEYEQTGVTPTGTIGMPAKFDPLNETSGDDYKKTQKIARQLSLDRAEQVFKDRDIDIERIDLRRLDAKLWTAWKASSTSEEGQLLQVATADELGGRLNEVTGRDGKIRLEKDVIAKKADKDYGDVGGYEGIKAYVRAKWETTQMLLDKAGLQELELYRGIVLPKEQYEEAEAYSVAEGGYKKVPHLNVVRNGAASTTFNPDIANGWSSDGSRIVLRALMPRTAALSIPAYGINVKSEQEVVVAGTAWKAWDAWIEKAPKLSAVKMKVA
jgi:phage-related protein (TIGR01555 family)